MNKFSTYFTSFKSRKTGLESLFLSGGFYFHFLSGMLRIQTNYFPSGVGVGILTDRDQWSWPGELSISERPKTILCH